MTKNPLINALAALVYITLVATIMFNGNKMAGPDKSIIVPMAIMSLFSLSAAIMSYIFGSEPLQLYLDGKRKEAVKLFLQTVAIFAGITVILLTLLFSRLLF